MVRHLSWNLSKLSMFPSMFEVYTEVIASSMYMVALPVFYQDHQPVSNFLLSVPNNIRHTTDFLFNVTFLIHFVSKGFQLARSHPALHRYGEKSASVFNFSLSALFFLCLAVIMLLVPKLK